MRTSVPAGHPLGPPPGNSPAATRWPRGRNWSRPAVPRRRCNRWRRAFASGHRENPGPSRRPVRASARPGAPKGPGFRPPATAPSRSSQGRGRATPQAASPPGLTPSGSPSVVRWSRCARRPVRPAKAPGTGPEPARRPAPAPAEQAPRGSFRRVSRSSADSGPSWPTRQPPVPPSPRPTRQLLPAPGGCGSSLPFGAAGAVGR